jgi:BMFP domain-containing protein YqiC
MARYSDLTPRPTQSEVTRAMQRLVNRAEPTVSREDFDSALCALIVAERVERAALVARMMSDA